MTGVDLIFYVFACISIIGACSVVSSNNPVLSVLFLIVSFISAASTFLLIGAEFVSMVIMIVYIGAIVILFLFIVMMIDISVCSKKTVSFFSKFCHAVFVILMCAFFIYVYDVADLYTSNVDIFVSKLSNVAEIGNVLYSDFFYDFQISGIILLVTMVGTIILALDGSSKAKTADTMVQVLRDPKDTVVLCDIESKTGVE